MTERPMSNQTEWDRLLVTAFFKYPDMRMHSMADRFRDAGHDLSGLRRVPRYERHWQSSVTRFCSAFIPRLGRYLWARSARDTEEIVGLLARSRLDTESNAADAKKARSERSQFDAADGAYRANVLGYAAHRDHSQKSARSAWGVCKA